MDYPGEMAREPVDVAICAIYQDEARFLPEWIAFEYAMGVRRFYLYNDESRDNSRQVLEPLIQSGVVVHHDELSLPGHAEARAARDPKYHQQGWSYTHCLRNYSAEARWMGFLDVDEFLFSPTGKQLPEVLATYERWPGIVVNRVTYGTSGHVTEPDGLLIENYTQRLGVDYPISCKSVVQLERVKRMVNGHSFAYHDGLAVNERGEEVEGWFAEPQTWDTLRINHYWTKSEEWCNSKFSRPRWGFPLNRPWARKPDDEMLRRMNEVDDPILAPMAPAVRDWIKRLWAGDEVAA